MNINLLNNVLLLFFLSINWDQKRDLVEITRRSTLSCDAPQYSTMIYVAIATFTLYLPEVSRRSLGGSFLALCSRNTGCSLGDHMWARLRTKFVNFT